jgi:hypothetical protein
MTFDRELLALIRRAAPTQSDMVELIAAIIADFTDSERRAIFAELEAAGVLGSLEGYLAHSAAYAEPLPVREVSNDYQDWMLGQLRERFPAQPVVDLTNTTDMERDLFSGMARLNRLVLLVVEGRQVVPTFQLERVASDRSLPRFAVQRTNQILRVGEDPWGALSWWTSPNGWLDGGRSPADLIGTDAEATVSELAESLLANAG